MKAIVWTRYGPPDGLQLKEVEKPTPRGNEVLIRVHAATVTAGDCEMRSLRLSLGLSLLFRMYVGLRKPTRLTILGQEVAGDIEAVGEDVKLRKEGEAVFASTGLRFGAYAEYVSLPEDGVMATKPVDMTYEEAAAVPVGGLNALHFLRKGRVGAGQTVLINGAAGSIGTMAVQIAKSFGAEVTAVDSTGKLSVLRSIGADRVIDYTQEDFTERGESYDAILDVVGKAPYSGCVRSLKEEGVYLLANSTVSRRLRGRWTSMRGGKRVIAGAASYRAEDLAFLKGLIEAGKVRSVIDRRYTLEQVAEAHRYVETGQKKGNVVILVGHGDEGSGAQPTAKVVGPREPHGRG